QSQAVARPQGHGRPRRDLAQLAALQPFVADDGGGRRRGARGGAARHRAPAEDFDGGAVSETLTFVTCKDLKQAKGIPRALVTERLAACVNVVPGISSIYTWEGKTEEAQEVLLVVKSRRALSKRLSARVRKLHSYSVPEVVTIPIASGNPAYLKWVRESTT